jgi:hypothetical protein
VKDRVEVEPVVQDDELTDSDLDKVSGGMKSDVEKKHDETAHAVLRVYPIPLSLLRALLLDAAMSVQAQP